MVAIGLFTPAERPIATPLHVDELPTDLDALALGGIGSTRAGAAAGRSRSCMAAGMPSLPNTVLHLVTALSTVAVAILAASCSSKSSTTTPDDNTALNGSAGGVGGTAALMGEYGTESIKPVMSAMWIGIPGDPKESAGGPFIYFFGGSVTCNQLSKADKWGDTIPAGTQVLEIIAGSTSAGIALPTAQDAAANVAEVNFIHGGSPDDTRATSGTVTLTSYVKGASVDGTVDVTFPTGSAKGTFHATWCPGGHEH